MSTANKSMPTDRVRILIAEDEAPLRNLLRLSLEAAGHSVIEAVNGLDALELFEREGCDLVILDIMMPELDGFAVCREIRKRSDVPVIMLTALVGTEDLVRGFELGADDYITKPFNFVEVQMRIQAILRRLAWSQDRHEPAVISIGQVQLDTQAYEVRSHGVHVNLSPIEFQLLYKLMSNPGRAIERSELFEDVWGYDFVGSTNLVEVTIRRLREKIEADPSQPDHILTVRGVGYKFMNP